MAERRGYEPAEPPMRPVASLGGLLAAVFVLMCAVAGVLVLVFNAFDESPHAAHVSLAELWRTQPSPVLTVVQGQDLRAQRAAADARLSSYGWIDRDAGLVHIPIDRAIELVVGELPVRDQEGQ